MLEPYPPQVSGQYLFTFIAMALTSGAIQVLAAMYFSGEVDLGHSPLSHHYPALKQFHVPCDSQTFTATHQKQLNLALLETKPGAFDHARPLMGWTLPECFALLRRRLEAERDGDGTREYIKALRLLEKHSLPQLRRAVEQALAVGAITRDAVAQFLYPREDWSATLFSLDGHPHLRHVRVAAPNLASYRDLVGGVA